MVKKEAKKQIALNPLPKNIDDIESYKENLVNRLESVIAKAIDAGHIVRNDGCRLTQEEKRKFIKKFKQELNKYLNKNIYLLFPSFHKFGEDKDKKIEKRRKGNSSMIHRLFRGKVDVSSLNFPADSSELNLKNSQL